MNDWTTYESPRAPWWGVRQTDTLASRRIALHHVLVRRRRWAQAMDAHVGRWS